MSNKPQPKGNSKQPEKANDGWNVIKPTKKQQHQDIDKDDEDLSDSHLDSDQSGSDNHSDYDNGGFISVDKKAKNKFNNTSNISYQVTSNQSSIKYSVPINPPQTIKSSSYTSGSGYEAGQLDKFNQFRERLNEQTKRYYYFDKQFFKIYNCPQINGLDMNQLLKLKNEQSPIFIELRNIILSYINNNGGIIFFGFTSIKRDDCPHMEVNGFEITPKDHSRYDVLQDAFKSIISRIQPNTFKADLSIMKIRKDTTRNVNTHNNKFVARIVIQQGSELQKLYIYKETPKSQEISAKYSKKEQNFVTIKGQTAILQAQDQKKILVKVSELTVTPIDDFLDPNSSYKYQKNKYQGKNVRDASFLDDDDYENDDDSQEDYDDENDGDDNNENDNQQAQNKGGQEDQHEENNEQIKQKQQQQQPTNQSPNQASGDISQQSTNLNTQNQPTSAQIISTQANHNNNNINVNTTANKSPFIEAGQQNLENLSKDSFQTVGAISNSRQLQQSQNPLQYQNTESLSEPFQYSNGIENNYLNQIGLMNQNQIQVQDSFAPSKADDYFGSTQSIFQTPGQQFIADKDSFQQSKLHSWQGTATLNTQAQNIQRMQQVGQQISNVGYQQQFQQQQQFIQQQQSFSQTNNNNNILMNGNNQFSHATIDSPIIKTLPNLSDRQLSDMIVMLQNQVQTYKDYLILSVNEERRRKNIASNFSSFSPSIQNQISSSTTPFSQRK